MPTLSTTITGVSPAHFTCTGMGATMLLVPYSMRELINHRSPPSLLTPRIVYLSSFSGPSLPSLIEHQRPVSVALVSVAANFVSNSFDPDLALSALGCVGSWLV